MNFKEQLMKCKTLLLGIGLLLLTFNLQAQNKKMGVMLNRFLMLEGGPRGVNHSYEASIQGALAYHAAMAPKSKAEYSKEENQCLTMINKVLKQSFEAANIKMEALTFEGLTHEERLTEQAFFQKMQTDYGMSISATSVKDMFVSEKKRRAAHKTDKTIGPLANIFADKLDSDILVFFEINVVTKTSITISAYMVNGNSGKFISHQTKSKTGKKLFKKGKEEKTEKAINNLLTSLIQKLVKAYEKEGK